MSEPVPTDPAERGSGLPYPLSPPSVRTDLPPKGPGSMASPWMRGFARIVDMVLVAFPFTIIVGVLGVETVKSGPDKGDLTGPVWSLLLFPIGFIVYETVLLSWKGQTFGKWVCNVQAVRYTDGHVPYVGESFVRAFLPGVFLVVAYSSSLLGISYLGYLQLVPIVIYLSSLANVLYRGPHDRAGNTIVLTAERSSRRPR